MKVKPLIKTNPYLKDEAQRKMLVARAVRTSCGVEGIKPVQEDIILPTITHYKNKKIYKLLKQTPLAKP